MSQWTKFAFVAGIMGAWVMSVGAENPPANARPPAAPAAPVHLEKPGLPYQRNSDGRYVAPGRGADALRVGPFQSVQVNVAPGQLNVIGDAANEPSFAVDPTNPSRIAVGWRQFDTILSDFRQAGNGFTADGGLTWTMHTPLQAGNFRSDPVLLSNANGKFYYNSLDDFLTTSFFTSTDGGATWSSPQYAFGGDKNWFTIDPGPGPSTHAIYMAWNPSGGCCGIQTFVRFFDDLQTVRGPQTIPLFPRFGTVAVGVADNAVYVVGGVASASSVLVARSTNARDPTVQSAAFTTRVVSIGGAPGFGTRLNPAGLAGQIYVQTDKSAASTRGNVYIVATTLPPGGTPLDVHFIRSSNFGQTWTSPRRINHFDKPNDLSTQWFAMMDVAPNGRIDVLWNDTREDASQNADFSRLYYACSFDGGDTWHYDIPVAPEFNSLLGWPIQAKIGDYYDLKSDNDGVHVIYAATFNGEQDVYYLRVEHFDCNNNGVLDVTEIAAGELADCNGNDFPDVCEMDTQYAADCNGNGLPDDCDLSAGAADCNANRVPDACEIAADGALDCDGNGELDACQLAGEHTLDCNQNQRIDACEIAAGDEQDCNRNGLPDGCDISDTFESRSPRLSPFGFTSPQQHVVAAPPIATSDVEVIIEAVGDFNLSTETVDVQFNGVLLGTILGGGTDCAATPATVQITLLATDFNNAVDGGDAIVSLIPSSGVNADLCNPPSFARVTIRYESIGFGSDDGNGNGVPDECEGLRGDMNCDGFITVADIGGFVLSLTNPTGYAQTYPSCYILNADVNDDGFVTVADIGGFVTLLTGG